MAETHALDVEEPAEDAEALKSLNLLYNRGVRQREISYHSKFEIVI